MSTPSSTPRARRTAAAIEAAAIDLVVEHGYDSVTVDMICDAAGVSQRTFFNHFKTKDAALLGTGLPRVDERAARRFILSTGPLLAEAVGLIRIEPDVLPADPAMIARRLQAVSQHPALMARQMERLSALEAEVRDIVGLRLRQQAGEAADDAELAEQAELITHMLAGVMRYVGIAWARAAQRGAAPGMDPTAVAGLLNAVIPKLG